MSSLEAQLKETARKLEDAPTSADELVPLLERAERCLSLVEDWTRKSMQEALFPLIKALLVLCKLSTHQDIDVKVTLASCMSQIARILIPNALNYGQQMKEVLESVVSSFKSLFDLFVSSFEHLSDDKSQSYIKRASVLSNVANVWPHVIVLGLECPELIQKMFKLFFKEIRDHHPRNILTSMAHVMTLVLNESEDSLLEQLVFLILAHVKNDDENLPITRKLGNRVLESCASKVKHYLVQAMQTRENSLAEYGEVVSSICHHAGGDTQQNELKAFYEQGYPDLDLWNSESPNLEKELGELRKRLSLRDDDEVHVEQIVELLESLFDILSKVEQNKSKTIEDALTPFPQLLMELAHRCSCCGRLTLDLACCIMEMLRITAPNCPYSGDYDMQVAFSLMVSSFECIKFKSISSYQKRLHLLDLVSKTKIYLYMVDLDLDSLIVNMFEAFLDGISDHDSENVFASMEDIMARVLMEVNEISKRLLFLLISQLKKDEFILAAPQNLAGNVLKRCYDNVRPCLTKAVQTGDVVLHEFNEFVELLYNGRLEHNEVKTLEDTWIVYNRGRKLKTHVPVELLEKIFLKSSFGRLVMARHSYKLWKDVIDSAGFAISYHKSEMEDYSRTLIVWQDGGRSGIRWLKEDSRVCILRLSFMQDLAHANELSFQGYSHGCFCYAHALERRVFVLNPITEEVVELPKLPEFSKQKDSKEAFLRYGIGYLEGEDKFKVVCIAKGHVCAYVCCLGEDMWKLIKPPRFEKLKSLAVSAEGHVYWMIEEESREESILDFDLKIENFGKMLLPGGEGIYGVVDLGNTLGLGLFGQDDIKIWRDFKEDIFIGLKESCVIPVRQILIDQFGEDFYEKATIRLVGWWNKDTILIEPDSELPCVSYNLETGQVDTRYPASVIPECMRMQFFTYKASLYSLRKFNCRWYRNKVKVY